MVVDLAGAVGSQKAGDDARGHREGKVINGNFVAVFLCQTASLNQDSLPAPSAGGLTFRLEAGGAPRACLAA